MKEYRVCGRHSSKTENRLCNAVKLVPTSKKTTPPRVSRKSSIIYCRRTKQNQQRHLKRKILSRQVAKYAFKRRKPPQCDDLPIKTSHIFQILLKFFHLQSYVSTTRITQMSEKLLPQQGGDTSMSLAVLAHFTHPTKEWFLKQYAASSCQICRKALNNRLIVSILQIKSTWCTIKL